MTVRHLKERGECAGCYAWRRRRFGPSGAVAAGTGAHFNFGLRKDLHKGQTPANVYFRLASRAGNLVALGTRPLSALALSRAAIRTQVRLFRARWLGVGERGVVCYQSPNCVRQVQFPVRRLLRTWLRLSCSAVLKTRQPYARGPTYTNNGRITAGKRVIERRIRALFQRKSWDEGAVGVVDPRVLTRSALRWVTPSCCWTSPSTTRKDS